MDALRPWTAEEARTLDTLGFLMDDGRGMAPLNVRRLAAIGLYGRAGQPLRRRLILGEFVAAMALGLGLGILILLHTRNSAALVVGAWATGVGFNYVFILGHALTLLRPGAITRELAGVDVGRELGRYGLLQAWALVPFLLAGLATVQLRKETMEG